MSGSLVACLFTATGCIAAPIRGTLFAAMNRTRFDVVEISAVVLFALVLTIALLARLTPRDRAPHIVEGDLLAELQARFGAERFSQGPEEWLIRDFFNDKREGVFLDVGSFHPVNYSNTYRLERDLGWTGVAIDAIEEFVPQYLEKRPHTRFFSAFVADTDQGEATLHVDPEAALVASGDPTFTAQFTGKAVPRLVRRRTLDSILRETAISKVDFVSLDIELGEPDALKAFSLTQYRPDLVCIEAHAKTRQPILDALARAGYVVVGRYLRIDEANLYFKPLDSLPAAN